MILDAKKDNGRSFDESISSNSPRFMVAHCCLQNGCREGEGCIIRVTWWLYNTHLYEVKNIIHQVKSSSTYMNLANDNGGSYATVLVG